MSADSLAVPLIFVGTERDAVHLAGEMAIALGRSGEYNFHRVVVVLIAIDQHHGPLPVGPLDGVGCDQHISGGIVDIARSFELLVRARRPAAPTLW